MAVRIIAVLAAMLLLGAAASSPQQAWKAAIADQNKDYAQIPHAMLKIQDSAYLGEGETAVLDGKPGQPGSWRWHNDGKGEGALRVAFKRGKLSVTQNGKPLDPAQITKSIAVDKDVDVAGQPTQVGANVNGWRIFVYNQQNPAAKSFTGVSYFPYDPAFRVAARFIPDPKLPPRVFRTSRGTDKQFYHAGDAAFTLKGHAITLPFYAESGDPNQVKDISAFYTDALTGKGAYGAGRYVDVEDFGKFPPTSVTIDFNLAYNPNCARSAHFTCPLATDAIALAMTAGERDPHLAHPN
ncbi:MAG TPA: DUF1684 domain-containing protein [Rhizomicrobium sp.]|jgi:uncharacterized protein (DUF1684 family)|nr:DUF1684 domain-containing protein [Rhizomicrobium sp.]